MDCKVKIPPRGSVSLWIRNFFNLHFSPAIFDHLFLQIEMTVIESYSSQLKGYYKLIKWQHILEICILRAPHLMVDLLLRRWKSSGFSWSFSSIKGRRWKVLFPIPKTSSSYHVRSEYMLCVVSLTSNMADFVILTIKNGILLWEAFNQQVKFSGWIECLVWRNCSVLCQVWILKHLQALIFFFSSALKYSVLIVMQPPVKKAVNVWPQ